MIINVYVNNLERCGIEKKEINKVKDVFKAKFYMSDLRLVLFYLGMAITQDHANKIIRFSQEVYLEKLLKGYRMWDYKAIVVPIDKSITLSRQDY